MDSTHFSPASGLNSIWDGNLLISSRKREQSEQEIFPVSIVSYEIDKDDFEETLTLFVNDDEIFNEMRDTARQKQILFELTVVKNTIIFSGALQFIHDYLHEKRLMNFPLENQIIIKKIKELADFHINKYEPADSLGLRKELLRPGFSSLIEVQAEIALEDFACQDDDGQIFSPTDEFGLKIKQTINDFNANSFPLLKSLRKFDEYFIKNTPESQNEITKSITLIIFLKVRECNQICQSLLQKFSSRAFSKFLFLLTCLEIICV